MTLNVLWRSDGRLHMASDSRMSFRGAGDADVGVKIMRLPIRILGTDFGPEGPAELNKLLDATYGFGYAGSMTNAATFRSFVEDLLLDGQYIGRDVPLSFDIICRVLCRFCEQISTRVVAALAESGRYTFLLAGRCPLANMLRGAQFTIDQAAGRSTATYEEVAIDEGDYRAVGSGAEALRATIGGAAINMRSMLLAVNSVIDSRSVGSVGGDLQYGSFNAKGDFEVACITRISMEEFDDGDSHYGPTLWRAFRYRGFELYGDGWQPMLDFHPTPPVIELEVPSNEESEAAFVAHCRRIAD